MMSLRVAHFIQRYPPALGGSEAYFARLSAYLAGTGDQVTVFTSNAIDLEAFWSWRGRCLPAGRAVEHGVSVRRYPLWRFPGRRFLLKPLSMFPHRTWQCLTLPCNPISFSLWRDCGRPDEAFDVVHAAALPYAFPIVCARRLARKLGTPFFITPFLHLGDPDDPGDATRRAYTSPALMSLLKSADGVFVQTAGERNELLRHGFDGGRVILQGLGVAPEECTGGDRAFARATWQAQPHEVVIGHLANNSHEKGTIDLLRALVHARVCKVPVRAVLAGPAMPNFQHFWRSFTPPVPVTRLGTLDDKQRRDFYAGIDIFALPSRSDSFGLVLLEAWANGLANVAYRAGGIADVVRHDRDGLLVRCGDTDGLANALRRLVEDASLRQRLGQEGQDRVPREFRWEDKLALVRDAYRVSTPKL